MFLIELFCDGLIKKAHRKRKKRNCGNRQLIQKIIKNVMYDFKFFEMPPIIFLQ
jgi:hypothetical protein